MKKGCFLLMMALYIGGLFAQDFIYATGQHRVDTIANANYESFEIQVVTPTPEDITFKWELVSNTFDPNWSCSVCDYSGCYIGFPPSATMTSITAAEMTSGTFGFIKCNITCGNYYGEGKVEIYIYDQNDYNRGDTISFFVSWSEPPSFVQENMLDLSFYPNPIDDILMVSNNSFMKGEVIVSDILGKTVHSFSLNANAKWTLDFSSLKKGVYLISLIGEKGSAITKKIIKN